MLVFDSIINGELLFVNTSVVRISFVFSVVVLYILRKYDASRALDVDLTAGMTNSKLKLSPGVKLLPVIAPVDKLINSVVDDLYLKA